MKIILFLFISIIPCVCFTQNKKGCMQLEGVYTGVDSIIIQNPFGNSGEKFCVDSVVLNDLTLYDVASSVFMIDLSLVNPKIGDKLTINIYHKTDCQPKVIYDDNFHKDIVSISDLTIDVNGVLEWKASNELFKSYKVEQYKWHRWITIDSGKVIKGQLSYSTKVEPLFGANKFRVILTDLRGKRLLEQTFIHSDKLDFKVEKVNILYNNKNRTKVFFSDSTYFEVYDQFGNLNMKGYDNQIDKTKLKKGLYYINYDSKTGDIMLVK